MRVVLVTYGSLGDLHPALALAFGLRARGHDVVLASSESYRGKVTALGLPFAAVRPDLSLSDPQLVRRVMDGQRGSEYLMRDLVYPHVGDMYADFAALAAGADLLVTSELACAAPLLAARTGIRWAYFALSPVSFLSIHDPSLLPGPRLMHWLQGRGPAANRFIHAAARAASHSWWRPVRRLRRQLGLPPGRSPVFEGKYSPQLNLALFSPTLQAPQPDWPAHTVQPGFCFYAEETGARGSLPPAVESFLAAGEPPIVFTLGSAAVHLARDFYPQSSAAARLLGRRAVLLLGDNPPPPDLPATQHACAYLPHAAIFARAAAIVHQGGVGTTAQALRAGRPMLVLPFAHDQFDNAARVRRLGVACAIARGSYAAPAAAAALRPLLDDPGYAQRAAGVATRVRAERGVAGACDALEALLAQPPPPPARAR